MRPRSSLARPRSPLPRSSRPRHVAPPVRVAWAAILFSNMITKTFIARALKSLRDHEFFGVTVRGVCQVTVRGVCQVAVASCGRQGA
jgi:hypothetical protein